MSTSATFPVPALPPAGPPIGAPEAEPQTALRTFRDAIREISPRWLRGPVGGAMIYSIGALLDNLMDGLRQGVRARFPSPLYSPDALPWIGGERRIRLGLLETDEHYAARLPDWLHKHRLRGGPYALLEQVWEYYAPETFPVELRYASGRRFQMAVDGSVVRDIVSWTPPGDPAQWARWWLIYQWPHEINADGIWSDPGVWDDGGVWDCDLSSAEVRSIRLIPREWNAGHAFGYVTLDSLTMTITISADTL
jgi:hypothetical protein